MTRACAVCDEQTPDDGYLCHGDTRRLALALIDVPALVRELDVTITKRSRVAHRTGPARYMELDPVRMVFDLRASEALTSLRSSLRGWAGNLAEDVGWDIGPTDEGVRGTAMWLAGHTGKIRLRDWAPDMFIEVMDAIRTAHRAIDAPPDIVFMGHCPAPTVEGGACGAELWAKSGAAASWCRACGAEVDLLELRAALLAEAAHVRAPATVLACALTTRDGDPLRVERIWKWGQRGLITPVGRDPITGSDLYRLGDVAAVLARMERRVPAGVIGKKGHR